MHHSPRGTHAIKPARRTIVTLKIYGVLRSRTARNVWLAKELDIPFEHVPVIQARRLSDPASQDAPLNTSSPAYQAINPHGLIRALRTTG
jgi:glutathione S-transferase